VRPILEGLFDDGVATTEVDVFATDLAELFPEEAELVRGAVHDRVAEFRAGRHCARVALGALGVSPAPLLRGADRAPEWPAGFVGSITHKRAPGAAFCGAAAASIENVRGVGLDAEFDAPLDPKVFARVLTASEASSVESLAPERRGITAKIVFSIKEAVYKCQYPHSRQFLEFRDVEVELDEAGGRFTSTLRRDAGPFARGFGFGGRFARRGGVIVSGAVLAR
jgi:4'-phosphopantetheinyl transferase EntD